MKLRKKQFFWFVVQIILLCCLFVYNMATLAVDAYYGMSYLEAFIKIAACILTAMAIGTACRNYTLKRI
jgi:hypothetical protein